MRYHSKGMKFFLAVTPYLSGRDVTKNMSHFGAFGLSTGQFSALPVFVSEKLIVESLVLRQAPWAPPPFQGWLCRYISDPSKKVLFVIAETPYPLITQHSKASRIDLERLHLDRFCT